MAKVTAKVPASRSVKARAFHIALLIATAIAAACVAAAKVVTSFFNSAGNQFTGLDTLQRETLNSLAVGYADSVSSISQLDDEERARIKPVLEDAVRNVLIQRWRRHPFVNPVIDKCPQLYALLTVIPLIMALLLAISIMFNLFSFGVPTAIPALVLVLVALAMYAALTKLLGRIISVVLGFMLAMFVMIGSDSRSPAWIHVWYEDLESATGNAVNALKSIWTWEYVQRIEWWHAISSAGRLVLFMALIWWISLGIRLGLWYKSSINLGLQHRSQKSTSFIIFELAEMVRELCELNNDRVGPTHYMSSKERSLLIEKIEAIAVLIEGPWLRSLKIGYRESDRELLQLAAGISQALRKWKPKLALGGTATMQRAQSAFSIALLNACDGDWSSMVAPDAASAPPRKFLRLARICVKALLTLFVIGVLIFATKYASIFPSGLSAAITTACLAILVAQFIALFGAPYSSSFENGIKILELTKK